MLEKLAEIREAQSKTMQRFARAKARALLVETRLQSLRERMSTRRLEAGEIGARRQEGGETEQAATHDPHREEVDTTARIPVVRRSSKKAQVSE